MVLYNRIINYSNVFFQNLTTSFVNELFHWIVCIYLVVPSLNLNRLPSHIITFNLLIKQLVYFELSPNEICRFIFIHDFPPPSFLEKSYQKISIVSSANKD